MKQPSPDIVAAKWRFEIAMRREPTGPIIAREAVRESDFGDVTSELWMYALLRKHRPDVPLERVRPRITPHYAAKRSGKLDGYRLEVDSRGETHSLEFSISSLSPVAIRASRRLVDQGLVGEGDRLHWELSADCHEDEPSRADRAGNVIVREIPRPLEHIAVPIRLLQEHARTIGTTDERDYPVYYLAGALLDAARLSREGSKHQPPIETGAALLGQLCSCPETGEFFAVVLAAEPLEAAEETRFSLSFSARTWQRIQSRLEQMRARPEGRAARLLGEAHGHPFAPQELAGQRESQQAWGEADHTAWASDADITWARAVFAKAPFQLNHIFGKTATGRDVHALYGLRNGTLGERGFAIIPRFEPEWIEGPKHVKSRCGDGDEEKDR